ncbi:hypothetical protein QBC38DRAFT_474982 [Podospora fimiseda]|uniref:GET complex subunit GET2 n=1 Tax=Podospora fimiseda TaxID=252190 RepID=A0AAN7BS37_9PEZI|nr:hypothetical protein QBC38DRAFT_474982 [Podospora fimiseda]
MMTELTSEEAAASARAEEQARIRKAKREAKLKAGADDRLNKIRLGSGRPKDVEPTPVPTTTATPPPTFGPARPPAAAEEQEHGDPAEVDISRGMGTQPAEHFWKPEGTPRLPAADMGMGGMGMNEEQMLRSMMLGFDPSSGGPPGAGFPGAGFPGAGGGPGAGGQQDPMMQMMIQMLGGGGPGTPGGTNPFASMGGMPGMIPGMQQQQTVPVQQPKYATLFRLLHMALALALGIYVAFWTGTKQFTGTKEERTIRGKGVDGEMAQKFWWGFATAEAGLLSVRFFLDRGVQGGQSGGQQGIMGMLIGFLPQPMKGRVEMVIRYGDVVKRVKGDVLLVLFVLGVVGWWRGGV